MIKRNVDETEADGPPSDIMGRMVQDLEDTADVALARTAALYETITGHADYLESITKKHRLTQADIKEILSYAETIDQLKFLTNETILFLQKACKRIDQMRSQIANIEALQVVQEASKSAQERAQ